MQEQHSSRSMRLPAGGTDSGGTGTRKPNVSAWPATSGDGAAGGTGIHGGPPVPPHEQLWHLLSMRVACRACQMPASVRCSCGIQGDLSDLESASAVDPILVSSASAPSVKGGSYVDAHACNHGMTDMWYCSDPISLCSDTQVSGACIAHETNGRLSRAALNTSHMRGYIMVQM